MFAMKSIVVATLASFLFGGGGASGCHEQKNNSQAHQSTTAVVEQEELQNNELKVLGEGFHSNIQHPFVAVIRDSETYAELAKREGNLPQLDEEFFKSNIIVAVFLGERNTGGYSVEITPDFRIVERKPGKGMMVPEMITSPFQIVSVRKPPTYPISLRVEGDWEASMQSYHLVAGTFINSGGFAGKVEHYNLEGKISLMREGRLVTVKFLLKNAGETNEHMLVDVATGMLENNGALTINKLGAFTLVSNPNSGLKAKGTLTNHDSRLLLEFSSLPSMIADGYSGSGSIEGIIVRSAAKP